MLPPPFCLHPRQLVFITGLYLLLGLGLVGGGDLESGFILRPVGSVAAILILHLYELVDLFWVEVLTECPLSLGNLNLQTLRSVCGLAIKSGYSFYSLTFFLLPLCYFFASAVPSLWDGYL